MSEADPIPWYRSPIPRETLRELTTRRTLGPLVHVLGHIAFAVLTAAFALYSFARLPWPVTVAAVYLHGTFYNFLGMFTGIHELSHSTVFKQKWLNTAFYVILGILTWNNIYKFRSSHFMHHQFTTWSGRDGEVVLPEKFRPIDWLFMFTVTPVSGAGGIPGIVSLVWDTIRYAFGSLKGEWELRLFPESKKTERRQIYRFARITLAFHILSAAWFVWSGHWILLFVVTFGSFIAPWLAVLCALPQHLGLKGNVPDWRICARTVLMNPIVRFFYWNMNYHVEHHMFASVPFYNLPRLNAAIANDLPRPKASLPAAWRELVPVIRRQRREPQYCVVPDLTGLGRSPRGGAA
ncbi:MAG TPA: fatty acid desaturase [Spirochaetia bacterium]|nr:fatty acid desaturase [Spirochaetia bacterium]